MLVRSDRIVKSNFKKNENPCTCPPSFPVCVCEMCIRDRLEAEMKKIIKQGHEITRFTLPREEAIKFMREKDEPYKVELIEELPAVSYTHLYRRLLRDLS